MTTIQSRLNDGVRAAVRRRFHKFHPQRRLSHGFLDEKPRWDDASSESGGVGSMLITGLDCDEEEAVDNTLLGWRRAWRGNAGSAGEGGSAVTTMSEAPENHARNVGGSSRQPLSKTSATVQFNPRQGGVATASVSAVDSRKYGHAGSVTSAFFVSQVGGDEKERRKVSMLAKRWFAAVLRKRGGNRCTRCALIGGARGNCETVARVFSESVEPGGDCGI